VARDQFHDAATAIWTELGINPQRCFTSNLVLSETLTLLARRTDYRFAAERARLIYASTALRILRSDESDETAAVLLLEKYAGQRVSFCDCVSFVLMKKHGLLHAFTFDGHFTAAGFHTLPAVQP
jgi:predicted nucleic acid-binding protein